MIYKHHMTYMYVWCVYIYYTCIYLRYNEIIYIHDIWKRWYTYVHTMWLLWDSYNMWFDIRIFKYTSLYVYTYTIYTYILFHDNIKETYKLTWSDLFLLCPTFVAGLIQKHVGFTLASWCKTLPQACAGRFNGAPLAAPSPFILTKNPFPVSLVTRWHPRWYWTVLLEMKPGLLRNWSVWPIWTITVRLKMLKLSGSQTLNQHECMDMVCYSLCLGKVEDQNVPSCDLRCLCLLFICSYYASYCERQNAFFLNR